MSRWDAFTDKELVTIRQALAALGSTGSWEQYLRCCALHTEIGAHIVALVSVQSPENQQETQDSAQGGQKCT